jgi:hypothetical protein
LLKKLFIASSSTGNSVKNCKIIQHLGELNKKKKKLEERLREGRGAGRQKKLIQVSLTTILNKEYSLEVSIELPP